MVFRKTGEKKKNNSLFAAGVLGHSLGALTDCVFGQFTREVKPDGSLDFTAGDGVLLVVVSQAGGLGGDTLKDVVHERVHDAHGLAGDTSIGVHLLQHLVDVDGVALLAGLSPLLLIPCHGLLGGGLLFALLGSSNFARHLVLTRSNLLCTLNWANRMTALWLLLTLWQA